jgi:fengycin family lipopeptide synthetase E
MLATNPFTLLPKEWIEVPIIEHLQQITTRFPNKTALVFNEQHINYSEFLSEVTKKSNELKKHLNSHKPIAIWLDIEPAFIITKFACLSLGIPYVPLDANFPTQRNLDIIEHADVQLIVTNKEFQAQIESSSNTPLFILEEGNIVGNNTHNNNIPTSPTSASISYIIYTSGSTGKPKGVYQNQRNQLHDVWQYINSVQLTFNDRVSYCYSPSVNGSIRDTFSSLLVGATLYLTNIKKYSISSLNTYLVDNEISIFHAIPTIFRTLFLVHKNLFLPHVRIIYLAGDRIFRSDFELYKTNFSDSCMLYVGIGSTENATLFRHWILNKQTTIESNLLPVGYPIEDREMTIQDSAGKIVDSGEIGEIFVKSKYLSLGYWKDEELTQQYYTFHPDTSREFRTGDLGRELENGLLEFIGRKDKQLKINGHRVEMDEIRATILEMQEIENVAIISREINNQFKIVAYIQTKQETTQIQQKIKTILPNFMVPSYYYFVDAIPLLSNYKLDLNALNQIDKENFLTEQSLVSEQNSLEDKVQQIWTKYTGNTEFSADISWSETGANSIDLLNFLVDLEQEFNIHYPTDFITKEMTPSFVINKLKTIEEKKNKVDLSNKPVIYFFPWLCGVKDGHEKLIHRISQQFDIKVISYPNYDSWNKKEQNFKEVKEEIKRYILNETRPIIFFGVLSGTLFSHEIAAEIKTNLNKNILASFILDYTPPKQSYLRKLKNKIKNNFTKHYTSAQQRILHTAQLSLSDVPTFLFAFEGKKQLQLQQWKKYCSIIKLISFNFTHKELAGENKHEKLSNNDIFIEKMESEFLNITKEIVL